MAVPPGGLQRARPRIPGAGPRRPPPSAHYRAAGMLPSRQSSRACGCRGPSEASRLPRAKTSGHPLTPRTRPVARPSAAPGNRRRTPAAPHRRRRRRHDAGCCTSRRCRRSRHRSRSPHASRERRSRAATPRCAWHPRAAPTCRCRGGAGAGCVRSDDPVTVRLCASSRSRAGSRPFSPGCVPCGPGRASRRCSGPRRSGPARSSSSDGPGPARPAPPRRPPYREAKAERDGSPLLVVNRTTGGP